MSKRYELVIYQPDGTETINQLDSYPSLKVLQEAVDGLIQLVPNLPGKDEVYVNEEGLIWGLEPNFFGMEKIGYTDHIKYPGWPPLVGNIAVIRKTKST